MFDKLVSPSPRFSELPIERRRRQIGFMSVEIVKKSKKRTLTCPVQPTKKTAVDLSSAFSRQRIIKAENVTDCAIINDGTGQRRTDDNLLQRDNIVFIVEKPTI
jgi:hypothetical protein